MKKFILFFVLTLFTWIAFAQSPMIALVSNETGTESGTPSANETPLLSNFHIKVGEPTKVYFDASANISSPSTLLKTGFIINDSHTISTLTIDDDDLGGYFTVTPSFTYWDNNLIRLESGNGTVFDFLITYIDNQLAEPTTTNERWVEVGASGNGLTAGTPMSITDAFTNAPANTKVWIKAGNYGDLNCLNGVSGTESGPIIFEGYTSTRPDNPSLTKSAGMSFSSSTMPLLSGGTGTGINTNAKDYLIFKNIQVENFESSEFYMQGSDYVVINNCYAKGASVTAGEDGFCYRSRGKADTNQRIVNCYGADSRQANLTLWGTYHLVKDNFICTSRAVGGASEGQDYYITVQGGRDSNVTGTIVIGNYLERSLLDTEHGGHGVSVEALDPPYTVSYFLVEDNEIINIRQSLEARHQGVINSVYRDNLVYGTDVGAVSSSSASGGIKITNGANNNVFINTVVYHAKYGMGFGASGEDITALDQGHDNLIINSSFYDVHYGIQNDGDAYGSNRAIYDNQIINCVFDDVNNLYITAEPDETAGTNNIINTQITNNGNDDINGNENGWDYEYCNFDSNTSFVVPSVTNIYELAPSYVDAANGDFEVGNASLIVAPLNTFAKRDALGHERESTTTIGPVKGTTE